MVEDLVIIGSVLTGYTAAIYAGRAQKHKALTIQNSKFKIQN